MTQQVQASIRLRPKAGELLDVYRGLPGEVFLDATSDSLRVFDGYRQGGYELLRSDLSNIVPSASLPISAITGQVENSKLANSTVTLGTSTVALGTTSLTLAGLTSVTASQFVGPLDGAVTGPVTGNVTGEVTGNASTATTLKTSRMINGVAFNGSADVTVTADANTLSGTQLKSTVLGSSLTSVGTLSNLFVTNTIQGSISGNAGTVTNGVYTNQTYRNPSWLSNISPSKLAISVGPSIRYSTTGTTLAVKSTVITLDFGTTGVTSASWTYSSIDATAQNALLVFPAEDSDEWEMDPIAYSGICTDNNVTIYAATTQGPIKGTRTIRYIVI